MYSRPDSTRLDVALVVLRALTGIVFMAHGGQKLFVHGLAAVTGGFAQIGIPAAALAGPLVTFVEFFGGIALLAGLLTRVTGLGLAAVMAGAIGFAHLSNGFFAPQGFEFPLVLLGISLALALAGPGRFSLDHAIAARRRRY